MIAYQKSPEIDQTDNNVTAHDGLALSRHGLQTLQRTAFVDDLLYAASVRSNWALYSSA